MIHIQGKWTTCFFLVIFYKNIVSVMSQCDSNPYVIKSQVGGLAVDSSTPIITLQTFDGNPFQLWKFVFGSEPGLFHIVNEYKGQVLDIIRDREPHYAVLNYPDNSLYQQWFVNSDNTIVNAATNLNLDILNAIYKPGTLIEVYKYNGHNPQKFVLQQNLSSNGNN